MNYGTRIVHGPDLYERIKRGEVLSNDPAVLQGQTVSRGTRVPLDIVEAYKREGLPIEEYFENYPSVARWRVEAAWTMSDEELDAAIRRGLLDGSH